MGRTSVVKALDELYVYGILNSNTGNGLIKKVTTKYMTVAYDGGTVVFVVGLVVTGAVSFATGVIISTGAEASGNLVLENTSGTFEDDEVITDSGTGAAVVNGVPSPHITEVTRDAEDSFSTADAEVVVRAIRGVKGSTNAVITVARELAYDTQTAAFTVGATVSGAAGATGLIVADQDNGATGILTLDDVDESISAFVDGEVLTDDSGGPNGAAKVAAGTTLNDRSATFSQGDPPDEAKQVTVNGDALSTTIITGGAAGDAFEILRGLPAYSSSDYLLFVNAKTAEEGDIATRVDDKGQLQHRKTRADVERRLSMTVSYVNSKAGLLALTDQDIIIIAEREDDRAQVVSELHIFLQARINQENLPDESEGDEISGKVITARYERAYTISG